MKINCYRLASVQEQRLPCAEPPSEEPQRNALETPQTTNKVRKCFFQFLFFIYFGIFLTFT